MSERRAWLTAPRLIHAREDERKRIARDDAIRATMAVNGQEVEEESYQDQAKAAWDAL